MWSTAGCTSWFLDDNGVNRVLWPGFTWQYWRASRNFDETEYEFTRADDPRTIGCAGNVSTDGGAHLVAGPTSVPGQRAGVA